MSPETELQKLKSHARDEFYVKYRTETEEHDREFIKSREESLNTSLIFAGLFSAVTTAFIIDVQSNLRPDYNEISAALLRVLIHTIDNSTFAGVDLQIPEWNGPSDSVVAVQALLYASLVASLIGAFVAMLGKQWLNRYARIENRGSVIDRCRERQLKWDGVETWHFHTVMESLPLMLQIALLLLGCALSRYLWDIHHTVAAVMICATSFGILFYIFIVIAAIYSSYCPFQTPLSILIRSWIHWATGGRMQGLRQRLCRFVPLTRERHQEDIGPRSASSEVPVPLFQAEEVDLVGNQLDAKCLSWILDNSTDIAVEKAAIHLIPEISWHAGIRTIPSTSRLSNSLWECFDTSTLTHLYPGAREKAYSSGMALLHLRIQSSIAKGTEARMLDSQFQQYDGDLDSVLRLLISTPSGQGGAIGFYPNKMTIQHLSWMAHTMVFQMARGDVELIVPNINHFLQFCLNFHPYPPNSLVADCLLIIFSILGNQVEIRDSCVYDKSQKLVAIVARLEKHLLDAFSASPLACVEALECLLFWRCKPGIEPYHYKIKLSHRLFSAIIMSNTDSSLKWKAASLSLRMGYRGPQIYRPQLIPISALDLLVYLRHQLPLLLDDPSLQDSIADAFEALSLHTPDASWVPELTDEYFIAGICTALGSDVILRLRRSTMMLLHRFKKDILSRTTHDTLQDDQVTGIFSGLQALWDKFTVDADRWVYIGILARMSKFPTWHASLLNHSPQPLKSFFQRCEADDHIHLANHDSLDTTSFILALLQRFEDPGLSNTLLTMAWKRFKEIHLRPGALVAMIEGTLAIMTRNAWEGLDEVNGLVAAARLSVESETRSIPRPESASADNRVRTVEVPNVFGDPRANTILALDRLLEELCRTDRPRIGDNKSFPVDGPPIGI